MVGGGLIWDLGEFSQTVTKDMHMRPFSSALRATFFLPFQATLEIRTKKLRAPEQREG